MDRFFTQVAQILKTGEDVVLARIVGSKGSTPRRAGARMMIRQSGETVGTIGGGLVEAAAMEKAQAIFGRRESVRFQMDISAEDAAGTDMICGGLLEILCEPIPSDPQAVSLFEAAGKAPSHRRPHYLCTEFAREGNCLTAVRRFLLADGNDRPAGVSGGMENHIRRLQKLSGSAIMEHEGRTYSIDFIESRQPVFIFGAGHVGKEVAALAAHVGFRSVVLDDRPEFANEKRFPAPAETVVLDSFADCFRGLEVDEQSCIVILTRGHVHDKTVLAQALKTRAGYIGMIGSRKKRDAIYRALMAEGVAAEELQRVRSPIGLPIDTETPEEIAVSIVGELIQERSQKRPWTSQKSQP